MFTIIGGDGQEYGPVTVEQVRAWIAGGRASLDTRAKRVGEEAWRPLREYPEFAPGGGAPGGAVGMPATFRDPAAGVVDPQAYAEAILARGGRIDIGRCFDRSWAIYKANFWPMLGVTLLVGVAMMAAGMVPILGYVAGLLLGGVFVGGLQLYYLKQLRGQPVELGDAFSGFQVAFVPLMVASLLVTLLTLVGMLCLILPGIYLSVAYAFTYLFVIDHKLDFWPAMEVSRRVITRHWWMFFLLLIVGALLSLAGALVLVVGAFLVMPLVFGLSVAAYEEIVNPPGV